MGDCFSRGGRSLFFVGRRQGLNLFLSTKKARFLRMARAIHLAQLYYLVDYKKLDYA
ncbi:hypothetical protein [Microcoleus sp. Pol17C6]|uniref:hypothetical protein n=1 Tax=Microcoleus sp. Pol17C6 TaxID=3055404 RepID=UPI002FD419C7